MTDVIELSTGDAGRLIPDEALADSGTAIKPGHLVEPTATGVKEHATAAGNPVQKLFALKNHANGGTIDDVYPVGDTVKFGAAHSGQLVNALVAAAADAITANQPLESAGDGTLRNKTTNGGTVAWSTEAVDNSGGGSEARIKVRVA
jgi:hypothetical protein